jgi:hypothetical protein
MRIKHLHVTKKTYTKKIIKIWRRNETAFRNHAAGGVYPSTPPQERGFILYVII